MRAEAPSIHSALAWVALIGSTAAAYLLVPPSPWLELEEPCSRAAVLMIVVVVVLLGLRALGPRGARIEHGLLCVFLASMPLIYLESGWRHGAHTWLWLELLGLLLFASWAWLAYRRTPWILAAGIAAHGLVWDSWHHASHYIPAWYASACLIVDLGLAVYVLARPQPSLALLPAS